MTDAKLQSAVLHLAGRAVFISNEQGLEVKHTSRQSVSYDGNDVRRSALAGGFKRGKRTAESCAVLESWAERGG